MATPAASAITIPALTPVKIEVMADVGSAISQSLDTFPIRLVDPIVIGGREIVAAGTSGQGEVVHAKKAGGSGAAGELVLAARWLAVGDRRLRLRSMNTSLAGGDSTKSVNVLNAASAAVLPGANLIGFVIKGRNVLYSKGTVASAKTADAFMTGPASDSGVRP